MATSTPNVAAASASSSIHSTFTHSHPHPSSSTGPNPQLNGPSVTLFAYVFVAVALTAVFLAGTWRCYRLSRTGESFFPDVVFRNDPFVYGFGYYGFGAPTYELARNFGSRPRIVEAQLQLGMNGAEKDLDLLKVEPLSLAIPSSSFKHRPSQPPSPPHLHLSVIILPPSETPLQPLQRYPNGMEDGEVDLPELFFGTLEIDVNLGKDYRSRGEWEELRWRVKKEEVEWGRKMEEEEV